MDYDTLEKILTKLKIEDFIWVIYIGIIILSWYGNSLERKYFIYNDLESRDKYRKTLIIIFSILLVLYLYILKESYDELKIVDPNDSEKKKKLIFLSFLGSLFIAISGLIFLYIAVQDEEINVEVAFN